VDGAAMSSVVTKWRHLARAATTKMSRLQMATSLLTHKWPDAPRKTLEGAVPQRPAFQD
jgi:hypothetical protein